MADGVSTERTEHFDRPCTHVRDCRTVPTEKGDQEKSTKRQNRQNTRAAFFVRRIMREDEHSVIVKNTISAIAFGNLVFAGFSVEKHVKPNEA